MQAERSPPELQQRNGCLCWMYVLPHKRIWALPQRAAGVWKGMPLLISSKNLHLVSCEHNKIAQRNVLLKKCTFRSIFFPPCGIRKLFPMLWNAILRDPLFSIMTLNLFVFVLNLISPLLWLIFSYSFRIWMTTV